MAHEVALGKLIEGQQQRDAIHIAVAPVVASVILAPGQHIAFVENSLMRVCQSDKPLGIVDPFLKQIVYPEQQFWMFLYPNTITSLRHDWTHPAFTTEPAKDIAASEAWLRNFADDCGLHYDTVMEAAKDWLIRGDYYIEHGTQSARDAIYAVGPENFWEHYEILTGEKVAAEDKQAFFSCSC